jgi:SAM-dependent methyltransferase
MDPRTYKQLHAIEQVHWWFQGRRAILAAAFARADIRPRAVLDVGCGSGGNLALLDAVYPGARSIGVDIERAPLVFCRTERVTPVVQADVAALPFAAAAFDLVTAFDALEHVRDDGAVLAEMSRVCRPGGALALTVPAFPFLWGNVDDLGHHYRRYRRRELVTRVAAAGFAVRFVRFFNYLLFAPIAAVRLAARLAPKRRPRARDVEILPSDFELVKNGPVNELLMRVFALEASLLRFDPPFGVSLLLIATRPA